MNSSSRNSNSDPPIRLSLQLDKLQILAGDQWLLRDANATMDGGKITVIVGGSGAGKSVLLRTLAGLIPCDGDTITWSGDVLFHETSLDDVAANEGEAPDPAVAERDADDPIRSETSQTPRVGIVFQQFALFDELSPRENVQFAIDHRRDRRQPPSQTADQWLSELGVPVATPVAGLSGGQKQRLAIARTLAADPEIVLYDEPTSGLDAASGGKVAELIQATHRAHGRTSIVVTHDYETLLPIAEAVLLLDSEQQQLVSVPVGEWDQIPARMKPVAIDSDKREPSSAGQSVRGSIDQFLTATGSALVAAVRLPWDALPWFPRPRWGLRFFAHSLRLVGGMSACVYLILAGMIVGFTGTYFTFRFLPFRLYTQPLLIDELLSSIGFALYRILVPVLATILIAARCGAAVAADVGVKQYGGQVDALRTLGVRPRTYLLAPIVLAFVVATPILEWLAYSSGRLTSLVTFTAMHPSMGPYFWEQHFYRHFDGSHWPLGWRWVLVKNLACGVGTAAIGYYRGIAPKGSASDVSNAITSTVLWTTLYVLVIHFVVALIEFN